MKIKVDKEGKGKIKGLCDLALKTLGMQAREEINLIWNSVEEIKEKKEPDGE